MKKILLYSAIAMMSIASTTSCADVENVEPNTPGAEVSKPQILNAIVPNSQTKIEFGGGNYAEGKLQPITLAWAEGDSFSVYEVNGAWVADFEINDLDAATFATVAGGGSLAEGTNYIAVYPARPNGEASYAEYASLDLTSSQEADAASLAYLNSSCQMSDEFTLGDKIFFEHKKAIMTVQFDDIPVGETPTKVQFSDGVNKNYSLNLSGMKVSEDATKAYDVHMMIDPSEAVARNLTFTVTHTAGVLVYNVPTGAKNDPVAYETGICYYAPIKNQAEQQAKGYWLAIGSADALEAYLNGTTPFNNVVLTSDIDMSGKEITAPTTAGMGKVFDGNGYTISNLKITNAGSAALFSNMNNGGVVKNLTLDSPQISGTTYVGAFVGKAAVGTLIKNCAVVNGIIEASSKNIGGVAGQSLGEINGCSFSGAVTTPDLNAGGIMGVTTAACSIINCVNEGTINGKQYVGGIAGKVISATISGCHNSGSVTGSKDSVGGIIGLGAGSETISGCYNSGKIESMTKFGGIVGSLSVVAATNTVSACYNVGEIFRTEGSTGSAIAGIVGQSSGNTTTVGCYNYSKFNVGIGGNNGQIGGNVGSTFTSTDCYYANTAGVKVPVYGELCDDIAALNDKVDVMNAAASADFQFIKGIDATTDTPTLIKK